MGVTEVRARFAKIGGAADAVVWCATHEAMQSSGSHRWIVLEVEAGDVVIGGLDRGRFAAYGRYSAAKPAAAALKKLLQRRTPAPLPRTGEELDRAARGLLIRLETAEASAVAGDGLAGSEVPVGAVLDHLGNGSGHVLYPLGTPMSRRSLPPTDLTRPRTGHLLVRPLPDTCRAARVPPWFGQPGGGWMITLDRVIDYYCDVGVLQPFAIDVAPH